MIVDERGSDTRVEAKVCPKCGENAVKRIKGFGGHYTVICNSCAHVLDRGRNQ